MFCQDALNVNQVQIKDYLNLQDLIVDSLRQFFFFTIIVNYKHRF